jgi:hypothetical protein
VRRLILALTVTFLSVGGLPAQADSALIRALEADPVQSAYLARHPEILRWIGKHPQLNDKAKNHAINEWVAAWPALAQLLAQNADQTLAWADEPRPLADLAKKGHK